MSTWSSATFASARKACAASSVKPTRGRISRSRPFSVTPSLIATRVPASDARGLRQPTGDTGRPVEYAETADRDVHETGCRADSGEQVRLEIVVDGPLGLERVHAAEGPLGAVGEPNLRSESRDRGEGRSELVARAREFLLGESVKVEVHNQDLHSDLLGPGRAATRRLWGAAELRR